MKQAGDVVQQDFKFFPRFKDDAGNAWSNDDVLFFTVDMFPCHSFYELIDRDAKEITFAKEMLLQMLSHECL